MVADYARPMSDSRSWLARLRGEPLIAFAAIGMALFAIDRARAAPDDAHRIVVDEAFVQGLRTEVARRTGHEPDASETRTLVDGWAREEALYREARALQLDAGDTIVRRRLLQKLELLLDAEVPLEEPDDDAMQAYLAAHTSDFARPTRASITLCFVARELHEDAAAFAAAQREASTPSCDPALAGDTFRSRTDAQLEAIVGADATRALDTAPEHAWTGPFETPRGHYLVRVDDRTAGGSATLDDVRDDVRAAMIRERRDAAVSARESEIAARYEVVRL